MLRQVDDLADVLAVVHELAVDRVDDREALAPDEDDAREVLGLQRIEGGEEDPPAVLPALDERRLRGEPRLELCIAVAVRLLAVGREKVRPAGAHVAGDVLDEHGDAVRLRVEDLGQVAVVEADESLVAQRLQRFEAQPGAAQELGTDVAAGRHRGPSASQSPSKSISTSPTWWTWPPSGQSTASTPPSQTTRSLRSARPLMTAATAALADPVPDARV